MFHDLVFMGEKITGIFMEENSTGNSVGIPVYYTTLYKIT